MSADTDRLERFIAERDGECCAEDVEARLAALDGALSNVPADEAEDRQALRTLGDETRHSIVRLLVAMDEQLCVCEITPLFDVSESAVSHALSDLVDAGLLTRHKEGTWRYYAVTDRGEALVAALDATREGEQ